MSTAYGRRPSELVPIDADDDWTAYQLDSAVLTFGRWVENRLAERDKKGRPKYGIKDLLREHRTVPSGPRTEGTVPEAPGQDTGAKPVRQSAAVKQAPIRKVKIPESGIW
jgi:hypothetical protein